MAVVVGEPVDRFEATSVVVDVETDAAEVASVVMVEAADVVEVTSVAVVARKVASKTLLATRLALHSRRAFWKSSGRPNTIFYSLWIGFCFSLSQVRSNVFLHLYFLHQL
jgi:hypothetical protein